MLQQKETVPSMNMQILIWPLEVITQEQAAYVTLLIYPSHACRRTPKPRVENLNYSRVK